MTTGDFPWLELFQISSVPMSVITPAGHQVASNRAYAEFLQYDFDELAELDVLDVTREQDQRWTTDYLTRLANGEIDRFESDKIFLRKDRVEVRGRLSTRALTGADGRVAYLIGTIVPLPDDGGMLAPSIASRLLEYTGETITLVDLNGKVKYTKGAKRVIADFPQSYWRDRSIADLLAPGELGARLAEHPDFLSTPGAEIDTELEVRSGTGDVRMISARAINCIDDPLMEGYVIVTRDVTAERERVADLEGQRRTAEAVADAQTRLLATVSHELRNPLHAVLGLAELLASADLEADAAEHAQSLVRQLSALTQVTQDLLDSARLDAGEVEITPAPTDVAELIGDIVELGRAESLGKPVMVSSQIADGTPEWVLADAGRLRQVLSNLVGNAVKFTDRGIVEVIVRPRLDLGILVSVADTGVGIPADEQVTILEPFRVASTAGEARGAGLGLSIVQRLVSAMGGEVHVHSQPGEGTRFDLALPLPACAAPPISANSRPQPGLRVLVVEDNPVNQRLAVKQLERLGLVPTVAASGEDGLALLTRSAAPEFDVVLMDQQLPGWSGTETTQRIRALPGPTGRIPVIGVSASASIADRDSFIRSGMNDFVAKPASLADLERAIARSGRPDSPVPAIDPSVLDKLAAELEHDEVVVELVESFLADLDGRVATISGTDEVAARREAHTLTSVAGLLGAGALAVECSRLERGEVGPDAVGAAASAARVELTTWLGRHTRR